MDRRSEAMADLTGGIPDSISPLDENMDELWVKIKSLCENKHLVGAVHYSFPLFI
jgi:hypothetical protein